MPEPTLAEALYRVTTLERSLERLQDRVEKTTEVKEALAILSAEYHIFAKSVHERLDEMEEANEQDVKGLRRVLIGFSLTIAGAAIAFAVTTLVVFGGPT